MNRKKQIEINKVKKEIIQQRKVLLHNSKVLNDFKKFEFSEKFKISLNPTYIYIYIKKYEDLYELRKELRKNFGTWNDTCTLINAFWNVYVKDYRISYHWKGIYKEIFITICLDLDYKDIPEKLKSLKEGCKFKETVNTITEEVTTKKLEYICHI